MSAFVDLNGFVQADNGVFHRDSDERKFDYSDGEETEAKLHQILSNTSDLSSTSADLQAQIVDWPTEYHLSATRANLLRALDLSGVKRVLELGCGCGSITRYLGEQTNLIVDSIEGSPTRAALAALRCRELTNVSISTANFNQVDFPPDYYDLVLFVGVTEYAGRFSERATDQEALQDLLSLGNRATTPEGVVLVAIENRLGLKYLQGACEDHYAIPDVGLENYPHSTGIRTYSKIEWNQLIKAAGFNACDYIYPFPDYKVPTLLVSDTALNDKALTGGDELRDCLANVHSRDYVADFDMERREAFLWHGLLEAGTLAEHANSFLLLMSDSVVKLKQMNDFSIAEYTVPTLDYLESDHLTTKVQELGESVDVESREVLRHGEMRNQIKSLSQHAAGLQQTIDTMAGSQGWRWLNRLRRLLGRPSIK